MSLLLKWVTAIATLAVSTGVSAIGISIYGPLGGQLDSAVLFASVEGAAAQYVVPLGPIQLGILTEKVVDLPVGDGTSTHWWIIASQSGRLAYTSATELQGIDFMSIEPFASRDFTTVSDVLTQLGAVNNGSSFSPEITALLSSGHRSHVAQDGGISGLYVEQSDSIGSGTSLSWIGEVAVSIHDNIPPGFGPVPPISEPAAAPLLLLGLGGLAIFRKRDRSQACSLQVVPLHVAS